MLILARTDPRVLNDVLGFGGTAEHTVRNREQQGAMRLERRPVPLSCCHGSGSLYFCSSLKVRRFTNTACDSGSMRMLIGFRTRQGAAWIRLAQAASRAGEDLPCVRLSDADAPSQSVAAILEISRSLLLS
jgi:hypothetical protein